MNGLVVFHTSFNLSLNLAIRSSWSEPQSAADLVFCWLYRAFPSLAAKNIINLISVLNLWWCPCVESSPVLLEEGVCSDQCVLLAILTPACNSSSPAFHMMYSAWKLNKHSDNIQPCHTPFQLVSCTCKVLPVASWPAYRFLRRLVKWSGIPISLRIFQFVVSHTVKSFSTVSEAEMFFCQTMFNYCTIALISHPNKVMLKILQARLQQ